MIKSILENNIAEIIIEQILLVVFLVVIYFVLKRLINSLVAKNKYNDSKRNATVAKLLVSILKYILLICYIVGALNILGINATAIIAGAGVVGLALGFGAQSLVEDVIAGFFMFVEHQLDVGDIVEIDGFKGEVLEMGFKTTVLKNWLGDVKIISNGNIESLINYSKYNSLAVIEVSVAYDTDFNVLTEVIENYGEIATKKFPMLLQKPTYDGVVKLDDSSIVIRVSALTFPMEHLEIERAIRYDLKKLFDENGIKIPLPQLVVINV